ncbi:MAG TPA: carboxypeptidase-like regulatory domain-containing protein [Acidisarcina sp.]|nr:carboxypeptidase-like regulatory domain-containing protein [Acidisarcina sp.]
MAPMLTSRFRNLSWCLLPLVLLVLLSPASAFQTQVKRGRKYVPPPPTAKIEVTVLRASSGKPIPNAAVIFHAMEGEKDKGNMELKTNEEGKAIIDVMPIGDVVRLQVIANGFQTFGDDYKIETAEKQIVVKMKRPGEQYSIYKPHPEQEQQAPADATAPDAKDAPKK